jgi:Ni,Fe-hydrogenase III component G
MVAREKLNLLKERFGPRILRADIPADNRLFLTIEPAAVADIVTHLFRDLDARYVVSIGADDRPYSGSFFVSHNFAFDAEHLLCSVMVYLPKDDPSIISIASVIPGAAWAEREFRDLVGIEPVGHPYPKRLVLPDGWPENAHPLRKDQPWNHLPADFDPDREFAFDDPPEGCVVVPFGPFHPTLDEPAHFRLYVEGEVVRGCEYRGFMVHRGIEKLAESVLTYNDIPMAAERICGICGCVHNVAYAQAVEQAAALRPRPAPNTSAPSCSNSSASTATSSGSASPVTSSDSTPCSCRASASANRSCGSPRKSAATAKPTPSASSAASAGTWVPNSKPNSTSILDPRNRMAAVTQAIRATATSKNACAVSASPTAEPGPEMGLARTRGPRRRGSHRQPPRSSLRRL